MARAYAEPMSFLPWTHAREPCKILTTHHAAVPRRSVACRHACLMTLGGLRRFGTIRLARNRATGETLAVKVPSVRDPHTSSSRPAVVVVEPRVCRGILRSASSKSPLILQFLAQVLSKSRPQQARARTVGKLLREAECLARVQTCDNVVSLRGIFEDASSAYLVMEHCSGGDLEQLLEV